MIYLYYFIWLFFISFELFYLCCMMLISECGRQNRNSHWCRKKKKTNKTYRINRKFMPKIAHVTEFWWFLCHRHCCLWRQTNVSFAAHMMDVEWVIFSYRALLAFIVTLCVFTVQYTVIVVVIIVRVNFEIRTAHNFYFISIFD